MGTELWVVNASPLITLAKIAAVCQRQREKPARVLDASPERLDASFGPGTGIDCCPVFRGLSKQ
jgi:hypothetical protein